MAYGLGRGKRKTKEEEEAGSANCFSSLPNFASPIVWIIAHRFEFASQVGIPTPPPDSFLPFLVAPDLYLFLVLFHGLFVVLFKKQSRRVVVKKFPLFAWICSCKIVSRLPICSCAFLVKCIVGFVTRTSAALLCCCFVSRCFCWFPALFFARSSLNFLAYGYPPLTIEKV